MAVVNREKLEKGPALVPSVADKIQGPQYRHRRWVSSDCQ